MEQQTIKKIAIFGVGLVAGAAVGYIAGTLIIEKLMKENSEEPKTDFCKSDPRTTEEVIKAAQVIITDKNPPELKTGKTNGVSPADPTTDYTKFAAGDHVVIEPRDGKDLAALAARYKSTLDSDKGKKPPEEKKVTRPDGEPYVISEEDFSETKLNYDKVEMDYYELDCTVVDPNNDPVAAPQDIMGPNPWLHFGELSDHPDVVYIRNDNLGIDYVLNRKANASYRVNILGVEPEEDKKDKRTNSRRSKLNGPSEWEHPKGRKVGKNDTNEEEDSGPDNNE